MYGMVSSDHPKPRKDTTRHQQQQQAQQQQQQQQSQEGGAGQPPRSFCGRFLGFMKQAWTGVKFALGKTQMTLNNMYQIH